METQLSFYQVFSWLLISMTWKYEMYFNQWLEWYHNFRVIEAEWHISASNLTIFGSDNGFLPSQHQAII